MQKITSNSCELQQRINHQEGDEFKSETNSMKNGCQVAAEDESFMKNTLGYDRSRAGVMKVLGVQ